MNTWAKYVVSFFILVVVLSVIIYTFGPREYRDAYRSGLTPVGQLPADSHLVSRGQQTTTGDTTSATTQPPPPAPAAAQPADTSK